MAEERKKRPTVLFICFVDMGKNASGSGMRPEKMYRAFLTAGCQVKLLSGSQEKQYREERRANVAEISRWLDSHRPELCYVESPVYPILWPEDRALLQKIHALDIPLGYFYRDYYRRFPELFPRRSSLVGRVKELWLDHLQKKTNRLLRACDIVYFPSRQAAALFDYRKWSLLPPGGEEHSPAPAGEGRTCIYVGGLTNHYGGETLLRAFALLNREKTEYPLILVCRAGEWAAMPAEYRTAPWLELHHVSGAALEPLYRRAGAGLIADRLPNAYNDLAHSVKLFEYMSYGLPVVYVKSVATHEFVSRYSFGIGTEFSPESLADGVREMFADEHVYAQRRAAAREALLSGNRWIDRAEQVIRELTEVKTP